MQGDTRSHQGTRWEHKNSEGTLTSKLQTSRTTLVKTSRIGFVFRLNGESDSIMYHRNDPTTTVPLFLLKKSLRVHARPLIHHVRLHAVDDIPVRLSSRSPTNLVDRRSDELALPKHGKLDKWTRGEQRENELLGERLRRRTMLKAWSVPRDGE